MKATIETVTPAIATEFLASSHGNRTLKAAKIASYVRDMQSGRWMVNGEPIIFDDCGHLIDGHHRLTACVKAGIEFQSLIVRGVQRDARNTIDMGSSRTIGDVLVFSGERNANSICAAINAAVSIGNGRPRSANLSASEILDFMSSYPQVRDFAADEVRKSLPRVGAVLSGIGVIASCTGKDEMFSRFIDVLRTGIPSRDGCPAHVLRDKILKDAAHKRQMPLQDAHRLTLSAWNKFTAGARVQALRTDPRYGIDGWRPEICDRMGAE